eukprot:TRINITY_DN768_c0_g1_i33.p1 TRINITY_DN768_c0_g1~~TRINITY_DN768_c0_g1_i33.p1  ORF type:complete len:981 (+),score=271.20 TRINITY_DN768_c0_g1_i33:126-3068(+)
MIRRPPRSTQGVSSAASDVYKRQRRVHGEVYLYIIRLWLFRDRNETLLSELGGLIKYNIVDDAGRNMLIIQLLKRNIVDGTDKPTEKKERTQHNLEEIAKEASINPATSPIIKEINDEILGEIIAVEARKRGAKAKSKADIAKQGNDLGNVLMQFYPSENEEELIYYHDMNLEILNKTESPKSNAIPVYEAAYNKMLENKRLNFLKNLITEYSPEKRSELIAALENYLNPIPCEQRKQRFADLANNIIGTLPGEKKEEAKTLLDQVYMERNIEPTELALMIIDILKDKSLNKDEKKEKILSLLLANTAKITLPKVAGEKINCVLKIIYDKDSKADKELLEQIAKKLIELKEVELLQNTLQSGKPEEERLNLFADIVMEMIGKNTDEVHELALTNLMKNLRKDVSPELLRLVNLGEEKYLYLRKVLRLRDIILEKNKELDKEAIVEQLSNLVDETRHIPERKERIKYVIYEILRHVNPTEEIEVRKILENMWLARKLTPEDKAEMIEAILLRGGIPDDKKKTEIKDILQKDLTNVYPTIPNIVNTVRKKLIIQPLRKKEIKKRINILELASSEFLIDENSRKVIEIYESRGKTEDDKKEEIIKFLRSSTANREDRDNIYRLTIRLVLQTKNTPAQQKFFNDILDSLLASAAAEAPKLPLNEPLEEFKKPPPKKEEKPQRTEEEKQLDELSEFSRRAKKNPMEIKNIMGKDLEKLPIVKRRERIQKMVLDLKKKKDAKCTLELEEMIEKETTDLIYSELKDNLKDLSGKPLDKLEKIVKMFEEVTIGLSPEHCEKEIKRITEFLSFHSPRKSRSELGRLTKQAKDIIMLRRKMLNKYTPKEDDESILNIFPEIMGDKAEEKDEKPFINIFIAGLQGKPQNKLQDIIIKIFTNKRNEENKKRLADEAEKKRLADEAEKKRLADEAEKKRLADEAEKKRLADEAEKKRLANEAKKKRLAMKLKTRLRRKKKRLADEAEKKKTCK